MAHYLEQWCQYLQLFLSYQTTIISSSWRDSKLMHM